MFQNLNQFSPTFLFIGIAVFLFIFVFWNEGKRDGFDKYRLFDLIFTLLILSGMLYVSLDRWLYDLSVFHYKSIFLKIDPDLFKITLIYLLWILGITSFSQQFRWSNYRLLDIFAVSLIIMALPLVVYLTYINQNALTLVYYLPYLVGYRIIFSKRSNFGFISGFGFILFNLLSSIIVALLYNLTGRLPIALIFLTISLVTIYFRKRISMAKSNLTKSFLDFIKGQLTSKDKELVKQEQLLNQEDPYLQKGRTEDNSEEMDEAILEDNRKEITDARLSLIKSMRIQVKRALAFLKVGKYGICEICGKPIDTARLKIYPEATTCVEHASKSRR